LPESMIVSLRTLHLWQGNRHDEAEHLIDQVANREIPSASYVIQASCWTARPAWMTRPYSNDLRERRWPGAAGETIRVVAAALRISPRAFKMVGRCARPAACLRADWRPQARVLSGAHADWLRARVSSASFTLRDCGGACRARVKVDYRSVWDSPSRGAELQKKTVVRPEQTRPTSLANAPAGRLSGSDRSQASRLHRRDWVKTNMAPSELGAARPAIASDGSLCHWQDHDLPRRLRHDRIDAPWSSTAQSTANCSSSMSGRSLSTTLTPETCVASIISVPNNRMP